MSQELVDAIRTFGLALSAVTVLSAIVVFIFDRDTEKERKRKKRKKILRKLKTT
jgi:hypothetical protein